MGIVRVWGKAAEQLLPGLDTVEGRTLNLKEENHKTLKPAVNKARQNAEAMT